MWLNRFGVDASGLPAKSFWLDFGWRCARRDRCDAMRHLLSFSIPKSLLIMQSFSRSRVEVAVGRAAVARDAIAPGHRHP